MRIDKKLLFVFAILVGIPLVLNFWISRKDKYYDYLVQRYECEPRKCEADFNGDGRLERLERMKGSSTSPSESLVLTDGKHELLKVPYDYIDGSLRTHVAIRTDSGRATLILFDGTKGGKPDRKVFRWEGMKMAEVLPLTEDLKILTAMAARDDAGTWTNWGLYRAFFVPLVIGYYLLIALTVAALVIPRLLSARPSKNQASP